MDATMTVWRTAFIAGSAFSKFPNNLKLLNMNLTIFLKLWRQLFADKVLVTYHFLGLIIYEKLIHHKNDFKIIRHLDTE